MVGWDRFESLRRLLRFADREVVLVFKMLAELLFWRMVNWNCDLGFLFLWGGVAVEDFWNQYDWSVHQFCYSAAQVILSAMPACFACQFLELLSCFYGATTLCSLVWPQVKWWLFCSWDLVCFWGLWAVESLKLVFILHIFLLIVHLITGRIITLINIYGRKTSLSRAEHTGDRIWRQVWTDKFFRKFPVLYLILFIPAYWIISIILLY